MNGTRRDFQGGVFMPRTSTSVLRAPRIAMMLASIILGVGFVNQTVLLCDTSSLELAVLESSESTGVFCLERLE